VAAEPDPVIYKKEGGVAWVTLDRPAALNAINLRMRDRLWEVLQAIRDDPDVGVAIVAGAGERAFCAGADIKEFGTAPSYIAARAARQARDVWSIMLHLDKPLIAAVHGFAYGGGCELSLYCDLRIAAEDARFGLPEVTLAYLPSAGGTQLLPRTISPGVALGMILSGEPIDAREALRLGLVQRVVPRAELLGEARRMAALLLSLPRAALLYAKEAIREGLSLPLEQGLALEARLAMLALADTRRERER
jgi:enoyl-CoA hydratase/carnithine racemase